MLSNCSPTLQVSRLFRSLVVAMALKLLPVVFALSLTSSALNVDGYNLCITPYALCSKAFCRPIPSNSTHVDCYCEGPFDDLNIGQSTCKSRIDSLTSTFSYHNIFPTVHHPVTYMVNCSDQCAGPWADCLDAPCSSTMDNVVCTCPLQPASSNVILSSICPKNGTLCQNLRSAIAGTGVGNIGVLLSSFYGNPPSLQSCSSN